MTSSRSRNAQDPYQANCTHSVLSKMFDMAELWGLRSDGSNLCLQVKRFREEERKRFPSAGKCKRPGNVLDEQPRRLLPHLLDGRGISAADTCRLLALGDPEVSLGTRQPGGW